jgi:hypothetical protein
MVESFKIKAKEIIQIPVAVCRKAGSDYNGK